MKQTAVEWLEDCFNRYGAVLKSDFIKAKVMEKQQIIDAYASGYIDGVAQNKITAEEYYNETFKK